MLLRLIRHAQPAYVVDGALYNDPELTALGHTQAQMLADRDWGRVDELWLSPMVRAQQTATPLAECLGLTPITQDWMHEIAAPADWEGSPVDKLDELFARYNLRAIEELWEGLPGGESFRDFHERVVGGLTATLAGYGAEPIVTDDDHPNLWSEPSDVSILFLAHGGTNAVVLTHLLGAEPTPWEWDRFDSAHTSVATLRTRRVAHAVAFGMTGFGDVSHLAADLVTR
ncbi:MAG: histidine phosphatase family protein [Actinobacteria bacterium]|nr:histidine phosphatase family protein [Actinomycetota bacterium]